MFTVEQDPVLGLGWHLVYEEVGRRKLGRDPHRNGRFTAIVEERENGLYKAETEDALFTIPNHQLFSTRYDIHHYWLCFRR